MMSGLLASKCCTVIAFYGYILTKISSLRHGDATFNLIKREIIDLPPEKVIKDYAMGFTDTFNYILFKNPVSSSVIDSTKYIGGTIGNYAWKSTTPPPPQPTISLPKELLNLSVSRVVFSGTPYVRIAGLSGAIAVILGAYGAHVLLTKRVPVELATEEKEQMFAQARAELDDRKRVFETANRYHFFHTLALFGVPLARRPKVVFSVMSLGMVVFCGTCYYDSLTGDKRFRKYTPIGGSLLILGWICFIL